MDLEQKAIERLKLASDMSLQFYKQPLVVTTSGGKDSSVCVALAQRAGIPFEVMHNHTTADAPETVYFVRDELERVKMARDAAERITEDFVDYATSGVPNASPYCANRSQGCTDLYGWCVTEKCRGFFPAAARDLRKEARAWRD